jgi:hypothetical protein
MLVTPPAGRYAHSMDARDMTDQAWFWTEEWQAGGREVDEEIARGEVTEFASADDLVAYLRSLPHDTTPD